MMEITKTDQPMAVRKGNINQAVCRWYYEDIPFSELCLFAKFSGIKGIYLIGPMHWPVLKQYGLTSSMCNGAEISFTEGWNIKEYHAELITNYSKMIPLVAQAGSKNLLCFSGNRNGLDDQTDLNNCEEGLAQILPIAEQFEAILCMELLNSSIDHVDYQCDNTAWGVALCDKLSSTISGYYVISTTCKSVKVILSKLSKNITHTLPTII